MNWIKNIAYDLTDLKTGVTFTSKFMIVQWYFLLILCEDFFHEFCGVVCVRPILGIPIISEDKTIGSHSPDFQRDTERCALLNR